MVQPDADLYEFVKSKMKDLENERTNVEIRKLAEMIKFLAQQIQLSNKETAEVRELMLNIGSNVEELMNEEPIEYTDYHNGGKGDLN